jgi:hypothetical protein
MRCEECRREADDLARDWRAMLAEEWETDGSVYVVTYCPVCAERAMGFNELVDLLRRRLHAPDVLEPTRIHSFKELMRDEAGQIADGWYWRRSRSSRRWDLSTLTRTRSLVVTPAAGPLPRGAGSCGRRRPTKRPKRRECRGPSGDNQRL